MLIPRRVKHRKQHHPKRSGAAKGGTQVTFGDYGIQALEPAYITNKELAREQANQKSSRPERGDRDRPRRNSAPKADAPVAAGVEA